LGVRVGTDLFGKEVALAPGLLVQRTLGPSKGGCYMSDCPKYCECWEMGAKEAKVDLGIMENEDEGIFSREELEKFIKAVRGTLSLCLLTVHDNILYLLREGGVIGHSERWHRNAESLLEKALEGIEGASADLGILEILEPDL